LKLSKGTGERREEEILLCESFEIDFLTKGIICFYAAFIDVFIFL
jgi:hypothetical protein